MILSEKANQIGESPTFKVNAKAKAMKAQGIDVIDLSVGEPDFPTPENIKKAAVKAIEENFTKYTQIDGIPSLKQAIIEKLKKDNHLDYEKNQIIVSSGAKSSLYHLIQAIVSEGDEVIIPSPYWVTYPHSVSLAEGKPVTIQAKEENDFLITPEQLESSISPKTKAIILNNPSNPTGAVYSKMQLEALADIILEEDIFVIADEIYEKLVYDNAEFHSFASLNQEVKNKTIIINGVSKSYSMTGWRIGYAAGPSEIIGAMNRIQGHTTSNPCSISQKASLEALAGPQNTISKMASEFQRRRNYTYMRMKSIPGLSCFESKGAFYLFPNISSFFDKEFKNNQIRNSFGMAYYLLKEAKVAVVPGGAFGTEGYIRISYATSMENIEKGMDRITQALSELKPAKKEKRIHLNNAITHHKSKPSVDASIPIQMKEALVAEMETHLSYDNYFEWNANINGVIVQLRTNVPHLYDFWVENWYPAQLESDLEPHGIIYAVDKVPGREPRVFYNTETKTGVIVNADNYSPLRSLALGLVMDVSERLFNVHAVRGMSAEFKGNSFVLIGPKGTSKTKYFFNLLKDSDLRLQSNEMVFVRFSGSLPLADTPERKLFMPTNVTKYDSQYASFFDNSKCENVVLRKEDCKNQACLQEDDCRLDRGSPFCYEAVKNSYAMLDPYWIKGPAKHVKRSSLRWLFILRKDNVSPPSVKMETEDALRMLESGERLGTLPEVGPAKRNPFYNPHILLTTPDRMESQKEFYKKLLESTHCFLINSGQAEPEHLLDIIKQNQE
ncbi:MAG TPA: pyridoxal phosphate-dependent aminotransferase [Acidobacteriota bacterium]|nr:pyridoxal phosphate-dependent aminotransferase [Acidobacteriota bacterium]